MPAPRSRRRRLFGLVAALLGLSLAVAAVELLLQLTDPIGRYYHDEFTTYRTKALRYAHENTAVPLDLDGTLYRHHPGFDLDLGSFTLRTNSLGFRGPEIDKTKPAGTFRILVLGDSVVFGWGVDDEHTFVRRFEQQLNARGDGRRYEVINTGHNMYDTSQELALLRDEGLVLQPDLVLLVYVVNDIEPTRDVIEQVVLGKQPDPGERIVVPGDFWTGLADGCQGLLPATAALLRTMSNETERIRRALPAGSDYVPEKFGKGPRGWPRSQQALLRIRDLCRGANVPLLLLDNTLPAVRALPEFCRTNGIDYDEMRFAEADFALGITNSRLDSHANARGHGLLLERLQAAMARRQLLPK